MTDSSSTHSEESTTLLLLGGTGEAQQLATLLITAGMDVIYSIVGNVRVPSLPCRVVTGGFSQFGSMATFVQKNGVQGIVDSTHPYADKISLAAWQTAQETDIPYWRFHRPAWQPEVGDCWIGFRDWMALLLLLKSYRSVLFTVGQLPPLVLAACVEMSKATGQKQWLRTAIKPEHTLPESMHWIQAIGPFDLSSERDLLASYHIDVVVSKNSGGDATSAKIQAARVRGIPILMLDRPHRIIVCEEFTSLIECAEAILKENNVKNNFKRNL